MNNPMRMSIPTNGRTTLLLLTALGACAEAPSDEGLVARVGTYALTVDDVAQMLVDQEQFPAQVGIVEQVADLWVEYVVLADAAARDSTFSSLDFGPLVRQQLQQLMILQLRDSLVQVDTIIGDAELQAIYEESDPPLRMRARHILLPWPQGATQADREAVRSGVDALRARILNGESFESLARQYSADPGTAQLGGDLGYFARGDMLPEFEEAVLSMQPGQVSDPVETQFGLHLIRLEERRAQGFEEVADELRQRVLTERLLSADSTFVAQVEAAAEPRPVDGAYDLVREMARNPAGRLSSRAARRPLVEYEGGQVTVSEVQFILQAQGPDFQSQVSVGEDDQVDRFLTSLVQRELLVARAREAGFEPPESRVDSLVADARRQLVEASYALGVLPLDRAPGEPLERAVERASIDATQRVVSGISEMVRLGAVGYQLRRGTNAVFFPRGMGQAVLSLGQLRANRSPSLLEEAPDTVSRNP